MIIRLIFVTANTGFWTALVALVELILVCVQSSRVNDHVDPVLPRWLPLQMNYITWL